MRPVVGKVANRIVDALLLLRLSLRLQLGRRFWAVPLLALAWPAYQALTLVAGWRGQSFNEADAQNALIGFPLVLLAIGLGVRVIAAEIEQRTLEVTYTVPGGASRVWISKLAAATLSLAAAAALLGVITAAFFTRYPLTAVYGAMQAAVFYLVLAAGVGALFRSEITAALVALVVLVANAFLTGFGSAATRWSPFFNPLAVQNASASDVLAWTVQNRIGTALAIAALVALACARAERREKLLKV
jgi:ABC-type transport system involved in multi-copper enzyme maturation permease subunit